MAFNLLDPLIRPLIDLLVEKVAPEKIRDLQLLVGRVLIAELPVALERGVEYSTHLLENLRAILIDWLVDSDIPGIGSVAEEKIDAQTKAAIDETINRIEAFLKTGSADIQGPS